MASNNNVPLIVKRSAVPGKIPTADSLHLGELAINTYDGKLFLKKLTSSTEEVIEIGGSSSGSYSLPIASSSRLGGIRIGNGLSINTEGVVSVVPGYVSSSPSGSATITNPYILPIATDAVMGGVIVGEGINVSWDGTISILDEGGKIPTEYLPSSLTSVAREVTTFTATEGQIEFYVITGYVPGLVDVYVNGVKLSTFDYVATDNNDIFINYPLIENDTVEVVAYTATSLTTFASAVSNGYLLSTDWVIFNNKAPIDSPSFTGIPTGPTAANGTNTTQLATTEFVLSNVPLLTGTSPINYSSGVISIQVSNATQHGYLSSTDWVTFNSKEPAFTKNTAFNKNFGTVPGTVLEGRTFGTAADSNTGDFYLNGSTVANSLLLEGNNAAYYTNPANIIQTSTYRFVTDTEKTIWNDAYTYSQIGHIPLSQKGAALGVVPLDSSSKILTTYLPDSVLGNLKYGGTYNGTTISASDDFPELNGLDLPATGYVGVYFISTSTFTRSLTIYDTGDWILHNGSNNYVKVDNSDAVTTVYGRIGNVVAVEADYSAFYPLLSGTYNNPTWLNQLAWSKITGTPTTLAGYGITDAISLSRTLTINGTTFDLSADRTWSVGTITSVSSANSDISVATGTTTPVLTLASGTGTGLIVRTFSPDLTGVPTAPTAAGGTNTTQIATTAFVLANVPSLSATPPIFYSGGVISVQVANSSQDGYLTSTDWTIFNNKQSALSGNGFVKVSGTTVSYDNSVYLVAADIVNKADLVGGVVPSSQLPSYVDDVVPYNTLLSFPGTGETGKIYIAEDTNKTYRWTGSIYVEMSSGVSASIRTLTTFTATAGQTTFTIPTGYVVGLVDVYVNGVKLSTSEIVATNGTTITITDGVDLNDIVEVYNFNSAFTANNALRLNNIFTATAAQTTFTLTYTPGLIDVFYNGSKLAATEYTATNGTSVILSSAASLNDIVEIIAYNYSVDGFSGVAGTGTTNKLAKFITANTLGDGSITDTGSLVTFSTAITGTTATFNSGTSSASIVLRGDSNNNGKIQFSTSSTSYYITAGSDHNGIFMAAGGSSTLTLNSATTGIMTWTGGASFGGAVTLPSTLTIGSGAASNKITIYGANEVSRIRITGGSGYADSYIQSGLADMALISDSKMSFYSGYNLALTLNTDASAVFAVKVQSPSFVSNSSAAVVPFAAWTSLYTVPSGGGIYFVSIGLENQSYTEWHAHAIIYSSGTGCAFMNQHNATYVQLRLTGMVLEVYQNGTNPSISLQFRLFKMQ